MKFLKSLWSKIINTFGSFIKEAINKLVQKFIVELKDFALDAVKEVSIKDLTNAEKRNEVFKRIKNEAIDRGLSYKDSAINLLIELVYQKFKGI